MKSLKHILQICEVVPTHQMFEDILISDVFLDSRNCKPGGLFCAYQGAQLDGHHYIDHALQNGAVAVLAEKPLKHPDIPTLYVPNLKDKLGLIASEFYDQPSTQLTCIGVTGTNGKTSVSHFMSQCLNRLGKPCGIIGTMGFGLPTELQPTGCTTPSIFELRRMLKGFVESLYEATCMEVSSHALVQQRTAAIDFDMAIFTNLTQDHLDYHQTMEKYAEAKSILFACPYLKFAVFNLDDPANLIMRSKLHKHVVTLNYGVHSKDADVHLLDLDVLPNAMKAKIRTPKGNINCTIPLLGNFNCDNTLAVISGLLLLGYPLESIKLTIESLLPVEGRMDLIQHQHMPNIIIDYAHSADALEKVLTSIRQHCKGDIICVFGCGGERDKAKRAQMARVSERLSDFTIVTEDNSRSEPLHTILSEIEAGFSTDQYLIIDDRKNAIHYALNRGNPKDVILLAGKGHEKFLDIGGQKMPFDERQIIMETLC